MTPLLEGVGIALESIKTSKARAALTILGVAIGVMVVMVIGAIISGFNKGVSDSLARMGPTTFWVGRFWQAGIQVSDGSDEMSPWRRNPDRKSTRLNSSHPSISYAVFCLKKKTKATTQSSAHFD